MQQVLVVSPLLENAINLVRSLNAKGISVYIVSDNIDSWKTAAPDIFKPQNLISETFNEGCPITHAVAFHGTGFSSQVLSRLNVKTIRMMSKENRSIEGEGVVDNVEQVIRELFSFGGNKTLYMQFKEVPTPSTPKLEVDKTHSRRKIKRRVKVRKWWLLVLILLIIIPFTILGLATAFALLGVKLITVGDLSLAKTAFAASGSISRVVTIIPVTSETGYLLNRITKIGESGTVVIEQANTIISGVMGGKSYDLDGHSQSLQLELQTIYRELSFLETEIKKNNSMVYRYLPEGEIATLRNAASAGADIAARLPSLLGVDSQKTYMVLLQNNMELRPTGGFIGSFALLHFSGGRLIDAPVYDVYSADGQLKGYVEPPKPIKEYLGEASWYLRDSNWDADFPKSASRAEWFLDKTLNQPIDGVIAVDLEFVRSLIAAQGSLEIPDFGLSLTSDNFYEMLQNEVHKDFFPGSRKKAALLTATMNSLISNLFTQIGQRNVALASVVSQSLDGRHIQIHLDDPVIQNQINVLGWSGEASPSVCGDTCEQIWLGLSEANVGVNKANYFIHRTASLKSNLLSNQWEHELTVTFENSARGDSVEKEHDYVAYLRLMSSSDAKFDRVIVQSDSGRKVASPEVFDEDTRKDAGVLVDVKAGKKSTVTFLWSEPAKISPIGGEVEIFWRKQAGVKSHPINVKLTLNEVFEYNSNLDEDFIQKIEY